MKWFLTTAVICAASGALADERSMKTAMGECFFVILSGQPLERRFPNATPVDGPEGTVQETRGDTVVTISPAERSCWVIDTAVSIERAEAMASDIARSGRIIDLQETSVGRGERALLGRFNDTPVLISWTWGNKGGAQYTVRVDP